MILSSQTTAGEPPQHPDTQLLVDGSDGLRRQSRRRSEVHGFADASALIAMYLRGVLREIFNSAAIARAVARRQASVDRIICGAIADAHRLQTRLAARAHPILVIETTR